MLQNIDKKKLESLMEQDPELHRIINQMLENYRLTLSTISHEIKNPLALLSSSLQIIQKQHPEVATFHHWDQVLEDLSFLIELSNEIRSFGNSEHLQMNSFSLKNVLECVILSFAMSLENTNIELTGRIDPKLSNYIGDKVKLEEVLLNLLLNAKQAIEQKQKASDFLFEKGIITLHAYQTPTHIKIDISDNGCGMDSEQLSSIFEPFYTSKTEGTGLGLSIAKKIVEAHYGTLTCQSVYGTGSTFTLTL